MKIVGCDLHTRYQQIAMLDEETGELVERRLEHANGEAKEFYTHLARQRFVFSSNSSTKSSVPSGRPVCVHRRTASISCSAALTPRYSLQVKAFHCKETDR